MLLGIMSQVLEYFLGGLKVQPARCGSLWILEYFTHVAAEFAYHQKKDR